MSAKAICISGVLLAVLAAVVPDRQTFATILYVDDRNGRDTNPGTRDSPLRTIGQAASVVNRRTEGGPTTVKIAPGVYNLTECAEFKSPVDYTEVDRLVIEATILPDEAQWKPHLMPVILSTEDPARDEQPREEMGTYSLKIKNSHVTVRGLKFLGNPVPRNWHACIERVGQNLDDLLVTQCMFVGNEDSLNIYCAALATGDRFVVDHCVFYGCHGSVVFWDGVEGIPGKGNAMRYCIVDRAHISGVWTCQTAEDFEFHHNIVTRCQYFWMRKRTDSPQEYRLHDCIVTNNSYYSGYGVESGATGQTGAEVAYKEENVIKTGEVALERSKRSKNYLHVVKGTFGSNLQAGIHLRESDR
jgi:hypothetical protein